MKELRVKIRVYNNRLLKRREKLGVAQIMMATTIGVPSDKYAKLERCAISPLTEAGEWSKVAITIAEYWDVSPEELWPDAVLDLVKNVTERELDTEDLKSLVLGAADDNERRQLTEGPIHETLVTVIKKLTPREQRFITDRFGLETGDGKTLEEVGGEQGCGRARAGQIEQKALRKLRANRNARHLRPLLDRKKAATAEVLEIQPCKPPVLPEGPARTERKLRSHEYVVVSTELYDGFLGSKDTRIWKHKLTCGHFVSSRNQYSIDAECYTCWKNAGS